MKQFVDINQICPANIELAEVKNLENADKVISYKELKEDNYTKLLSQEDKDISPYYYHAGRAEEAISNNDGTNTYIKDAIEFVDSFFIPEHTLWMNLQEFKKQVESHPLYGTVFTYQGMGWASGKHKQEGKECWIMVPMTRKANWYSIARYLVTHKPCYNSVQYKEYATRWTMKKESKLLMMVTGNNWNKFEAHKHITNIEYNHLLEIEKRDGIKIFADMADKKAERTAKHIAKLKSKLDAGEKLSNADRVWLANNKLTVKDIH